jgi:predicted ATPase/DNA-binding SARP family transcriptional activator/Tfp pilus assembly protein PilF
MQCGVSVHVRRTAASARGRDEREGEPRRVRREPPTGAQPGRVQVPADGRLVLLGRSQFAGTGFSAPLLAERRFQLLAYLAFCADWVPRDSLAGLLWPERGNSAARGNLRKVLHEVRLLPWCRDLEYAGDRARWTAATDVSDFRSALAARRWDDAAALYRGPFAFGLDDAGNGAWTDWLRTARAALFESWRGAVFEQIPVSRPLQALDLARRLRHEDAFDEEALRVELQALAALGRANEAQRVYCKFAEDVAAELGIEVGRETRQLADTLKAQAAARPVSPVDRVVGPDLARNRTDAGEQDRDFVGRRAERKELRALIEDPECRLVTVSGPGGVGKSRLARVVLADVADRFPGATKLVALEDLADATRVAARIAETLGVVLTGAGDPIVQLAAAVSRSHALLALDNAEHLSIEPLLLALLRACPNVRLLVTSRRRLGVEGESMLPLSGLPCPDEECSDPEEAGRFDAVRLFRARARASDPRFDLARQIAAVVELVRLVDGLPLAIELAAAWVRLLPVGEIASEVAHSLDLLQRSAPVREGWRTEHDDVRATLEHSWKLIAPRQRRTLAALSQFRGGFTRGAALAVADAPLPLLASLADCSLVQHDRGGRFSLHPLVATFAAEKLAADPARSAEVATRHAEHFAGWLASQERAGWGTATVPMRELGTELENCRGALAHAIAARRSDLAAGFVAPLRSWFEDRGRYAEGESVLRAALILDAADVRHAPLLAATHRALGAICNRKGEPGEAQRHARLGLALARRIGDGASIMGCLNTIGLSLLQTGRARGALRHLEEALRRARAASDDAGVVVFAGNLGIACMTLGEYERALSLYDEALRLRRAAGDRRGMVPNLNNIGNVYRVLRQWPRALACFEEGLKLADEQGLVGRRPPLLINLGLTCRALGRVGEARRYLLQTLEAVRAGGEPYIEWSARLALAELAIEERDFRAALAEIQQALRWGRAHDNEPIILQGATVYAMWCAARGDRAAGARLAMFVLAQGAIEASDRRSLQDFLGHLALDAGELRLARRAAGALRLAEVEVSILAAEPA